MPPHEDGTSRLDRAYRDTLLRPPSARERGKWTARLPDSLLRRRLRWTPEFRLGVQPFLAAATATLSRIGDGRASADDLWQIQDRWLRRRAEAPARWDAFPATDRFAVEEGVRLVEALFDEVLARAPDARTLRQYVVRLCLGLDDAGDLRRELVASDEHVGLARGRRAACEILQRIAALESAEPDAIETFDMRRLREIWRPAPAGNAGILAQELRHDAPDDTTLRDRARSIDALFGEVLMRPADAPDRRRMLARWMLGLDDLESLRAELTASAEHREVVAPLVALVRDVHLRFVHAPAPDREIQDAVDRVRTALRTHAELVAAIADGTVRRKLGIRPLKLELDVTTQCNLRCTMCYLSDPRYGKRERKDITIDEFRETARQIFPYCGLVSLSFGTEPLLHPQLVELLEITAQEEVPWRYLITNGILLDARTIEAFVRIPLHGFSVSIDAATPATYERIRRGGRWDTLMSNLRALQEAKLRAGSEYPRLTFNFVMMRSNLEELPQLVRLAHELGAEGVSAMHLTPFDRLQLEDELLDAQPERCNAVLEATRAEAVRLGVPVALPEPFDVAGLAPRGLKDDPPEGFLFPSAERAKSSCPFPWQFVGIDPYGKVVPCGWWYTRAPMGDSRTQSFDEIWNGAPWRELRREHSTGALQEPCLSCPAAGMGSCDNPRSFDSVTLGSPQEIRPKSPPVTGAR